MTHLAQRRASIPVDVGGVIVGGSAPIVVQSMTNTDTADVEGTARQTADLARAGSEIVRITVDRDEAAKAVPRIRERLLQMGVQVPLVGDFHYNGHTLLGENPACAEALDKFRINPGNVGFKAKRDLQFSTIIELAMRYAKPVRIGVNWGSLDQELLTRLMDENAASPEPKDARAIMHEAIVQSALLSAERAEQIGLGPERIIISAKVSAVQDLVSVYTLLAARCRYALHLGLTEAGMGSKGIVASSAAMGLLLQQGIGDTIRVSLTPEPGGDRTQEVRVAQEILQTMGFRSFVPIVAACPGCGRTTSTVFQELAGDIQSYVRTRMPEWAQELSGRREPQPRGDGLHRQRAGRVQARRHRHLVAGHRRGAVRARVHRRQEGDDPARAQHSGGIQGHRRELRGAAVWLGRGDREEGLRCCMPFGCHPGICRRQISGTQRSCVCVAPGSRLRAALGPG